jgi:hypothetical protein
MSKSIVVGVRGGVVMSCICDCGDEATTSNDVNARKMI